LDAKYEIIGVHVHHFIYLPYNLEWHFAYFLHQRPVACVNRNLEAQLVVLESYMQTSAELSHQE
jgi:hypothetical protein